MNPIVVTPPTIMPVTLDEVHGQTRVDASETDGQLSIWISAGTRFVENYTKRALITRSYVGYMDDWPLRGHANHHHHGLPGFCSGYARSFELPRPPLLDVSAITTYDDDDVATLMDPATYVVDPDAFVGRVVLRRDASWPVIERAANGIKVEWTAGFGPATTDVPDEYRQAILLMVSHFNEHREAVVGVDNRDSSAPLPLGVADLIGPDAVYSF